MPGTPHIQTSTNSWNPAGRDAYSSFSNTSLNLFAHWWIVNRCLSRCKRSFRRDSVFYSPYTFSAKERDLETGYSYFGARYYNATLNMWLSVDLLSDKHPSMSAYMYCAGNPVMLVDPDGRDWYEIENKDTKETEIKWTDYKSQQEMDANELEGRYLGEAVVVFEGSENEQLGAGDNLFGEGANLAKATVYGPGGADDIQEYGAYTMSSDPSRYGTVADGEYNVYYDEVGKSGALKSNWAVEGRGNVPARNGVNPAYPDRDPGYLNGVFIHRSNNSGYAGGGVSKGCPLIVPSHNNPNNGWDEFNQQLQGVSQFLMILKRD